MTMAGTHRLPPLPSVREIIRLYKLRAVKQLSQNFLLDTNVTNKIVNVAGGKHRTLVDAHVCEVGPGPGSITRSILQKGAKHVTVVEKDRRFLPGLELLKDASDGAVTVHHGDILRFDMSDIFPSEAALPWDDGAPNIYLIGNLPFSVSTPLVIKWLRQISERSGPWQYGRVPMTLTFQKEVGERMVADVNQVQRSRLSIMTQYLCHVKKKFVIRGKAFVPPPDVDVAVMNFTPRKQPLIPVPFDFVEKLVRHVFQYRQKSCKYCLQTLFPPGEPEFTRRLVREADINPNATSTQLEMEEFKRLCIVYKNVCDENPELFKYHFRSKENAAVWRTAGAVQNLGL